MSPARVAVRLRQLVTGRERHVADGVARFTADERKRNRALSLTTSHDLLARFDPQTSRLSSMETLGDRPIVTRHQNRHKHDGQPDSREKQS